MESDINQCRFWSVECENSWSPRHLGSSSINNWSNELYARFAKKRTFRWLNYQTCHIKVHYSLSNSCPLNLPGFRTAFYHSPIHGNRTYYPGWRWPWLRMEKWCLQTSVTACWKLVNLPMVDSNTLFMIGSIQSIYRYSCLYVGEWTKAVAWKQRSKMDAWIPFVRWLCNRNSKHPGPALPSSGHHDFSGWLYILGQRPWPKRGDRKMALLKPPYDFRTRFGYYNAAYMTAGKSFPLCRT